MPCSEGDYVKRVGTVRFLRVVCNGCDVIPLPIAPMGEHAALKNSFHPRASS